LANCFVCNFFSSSVGFNLCSCFCRLTLVFRFRFRPLWAVQSTAFAASLPLSDLRCFSFLSSASVLDSDYSASAFPFLLFPAPPRSCFPGAPFRFRFQAFPFLPGLISHAFLPGSRTRLYCSFPFALPCFAPTAACQVLALSSRFRHFLLPVRFLSSASLPLPATQPSVSSFPLFPVSPLSGFSGAPFRFRFQAFPFLSGLISRAFLPGSRTRLSVCFLSPFPDSLPQPLLRCFPLAFAFGLSPSNPLSFVRFSSGSGYSASVSSFPLFPVSPLSGFSGAPFRFRFQAFPFLSGLISRAFLPGSRTRLSVCFLSPFPDSLPQLFLRCFPSALAFGLSPSNPLSFVRFSSGSGYSAFRLSFPFFPLSPVGGSRGASFLFRPACFHAFLPIPVLGSLQFLSPLAGSLHSS